MHRVRSMNTLRVITLLIVMLIGVIAVFIQINALFNMDVSMLMHVSERMFHGGKYGVNIFESNPPMILYIYAAPIWIAKWFSINFILSCRIFVFLLIFMSLLLCNYFITQICRSRDKVCHSHEGGNGRLLILATAWVLLMPGVNFAQREHIMLILIMPYVYLSIASLHDIYMPRFFILIVAIMAGIGFCIKPHFFIPFFMYLLYRRKITLDSKIIIFIAVVYFLDILIFYPTYFTKILPLVFQYYYPYFDSKTAWSNIGIHFSFMILIIYSISFYFMKNHKLENVLAIYATGFLLVYFVQKSNWGYHLYPAIAFVTLLAVQMVYRYIRLTLSLKFYARYFFVTLLGIVLLYSPLHYYYLLNKESLDFKNHNEFKIIKYLSQLKNINSVYFLSNNPSAYPVVDYLHLKDIQLIQCYWFFPGMYAIHHSNQNNLNNFRNLIVNDILIKNPDAIVVSDRLFPGSVKKFSMRYFSENLEFKIFLTKYKAIDQFDDIVIFIKGSVYE